MAGATAAIKSNLLNHLITVLFIFCTTYGLAFRSRSALALSNTSELEIKNLLKQVDTMIHHKKLRWERQKHELDNKLVLREQEYSNQKAELEQKNSEVLFLLRNDENIYIVDLIGWNLQIKQLKDLLDNMESTTQEIMKKYEKEINALHQQVFKLGFYTH